VTRIRLVLILTENWTVRPVPDVADLVLFAIEAERAGLDAVMVSEHVVLGPPADAAGSLYDYVTRGLGEQRAERPDHEHRVTVLG